MNNCLQSLNQQIYKNYEIIVVNGPSTDDTEVILKKYPHVIIINQKNLYGLSYARNLGIKCGNGEIIAFIDDDAIAGKNWLGNLISCYTDNYVGGVGGLVYDGQERGLFQFDNGIINKSGLTDVIRSEGKNLKPNEFQILMGTNCSFRKDVLCLVGGFDPYFKYYHDESDLCVRIALNGYKIIYQRDAYVVHYMVEGHNRKSSYDLNWYEILKNVIYFTIKNFPDDISSYSVRPLVSSIYWLKIFRNWHKSKLISTKSLIKINIKGISGIIKGYKDGLVFLTKRKSRITSEKHILVINEKKDVLNVPGRKSHSLYDLSENQNMKLRILFLSQEYGKNCSGGICRYTYDLTHGLANLGHEVHVISRSEKNINYDYMDGSIYVHAIIPQPVGFLDLAHLRLSNANLSYSFAAFLKGKELIESYNIQIVEAPLWDAEAFVFSLIKKIPLVVRIQTPLSKVAEIQKWKITTDLKVANWMEGETVRKANKVIAISKAIADLIQHNHNIPFEAIKISPLGIELPKNKSESIQKAEKQKIDVLFVGRLEPRKGIETLIKTVPNILKEYSNTYFTIVGADTSQSGGSYKNYLQSLLNDTYKQNIKFVGFVDEITLSNYYKLCDIFVAPSLYESFGLIYLEAMKFGKPVVGCDVGGIPEIIQSGINGILVPPGDHILLGNAIVNLIKDEKMREKIGQNAMNHVYNYYSKKIMIDDTEKIYREVLQLV